MALTGVEERIAISLSPAKCDVCNKPATVNIIHSGANYCYEHAGDITKSHRSSDFEIEYVASNQPSDIFLSYSSAISDTVDELLASLPAEADILILGGKDHREKYQVFRDVESLRAGDIWDQTLIEAIFKTRVLIPLISAEYLQSPFCMFELLLFVNRHFIEKMVTKTNGTTEQQRYFGAENTIIPCRVGDCEIPTAIARIHAPIIPEGRPIPYQVMESIRRKISSGVSSAMSLRLMGAFSQFGEIGPDRDMLGLRTPRHAALRVLSLCDWFSENSGDDLRISLQTIRERTKRFVEG
jgi:TIR domain-containing protein